MTSRSDRVRAAARATSIGLAAVLALGFMSARTADASSAGSRSAAPVVGGPGLGDPLFPYAGNSGYQVIHYNIALRFAIHTRAIAATTTITAIANESLSRFDLDFHGLHVDSTTVDGRAAQVRRNGDELVVTPSRALGAGHRFTTVVNYHGVPHAVTDPDGSTDGWVRTADGADAVAEPIGAKTWFPCNNHPRDKATFRVRLNVPVALVAASNGHLVEHRSVGTRGIWVWAENEPMTTYLATAAIGRFRQPIGTAGNVAIRSYIDPVTGSPSHMLDTQHALAFLSRTYGRYPFHDAGVIVDQTGVGYALETQTRPTFDGDTDVRTLVHEFAHQWFGDSVSLHKWEDIWLNEGFATYAEWLWEARTDPSAPQHEFQSAYRTPASDPFWSQAPDNFTNPAQLFAAPVYERGAMTLQALRNKIGSPAFFSLLRGWVTAHAYGHGSTRQFEALAEQLSGQDLQHFFDVWLDQPRKPTSW
jgi:aminopeptidase N